jgi:protein ImuA
MQILSPHHAANLTALKALIEKPELQEASIRVPLGVSEVDFCLRGGLQRGVLHEVFAATGHETAATGFMAGLAARMSGAKQTLWIRPDFSAHEFGEISATGLMELGHNPSRFLLFYAANADDALRVANDALSCAALGAVIIEMIGNPKIFDLVASRRLTLAASQKSVTVLLLRFSAKPNTSTAETRWLVRGAPSPKRSEAWGYPVFDANLVRNRHGKTGQWFMEWNCDECVFQNVAADCGAMVSASSN